MPAAPIGSDAEARPSIAARVRRVATPPVVLFLHLPKTAGTTLETVIYAQHEAAETDAVRRPGWVIPGVYRYSNVLLLAENELAHFFQGPETDPSYEVLALIREPDVKVITGHFRFGIHGLLRVPSTYVTMLRHPVERVASLYHHLLEHPNDTPYHEELMRSAGSLEEFVMDARCKEADNDQTRRISGADPPFGGVNSTDLERAKSNLAVHFSVVGITERFDESLILMIRTFGWNRIWAYVPNFVNPKRQEVALSSDAIHAVVARNQFDVELYHYATGLLNDAIDKHDNFLEEVEAFKARNDAYVELNRWW